MLLPSVLDLAEGLPFLNRDRLQDNVRLEFFARGSTLCANTHNDIYSVQMVGLRECVPTHQVLNLTIFFLNRLWVGPAKQNFAPRRVSRPITFNSI